MNTLTEIERKLINYEKTYGTELDTETVRLWISQLKTCEHEYETIDLDCVEVTQCIKCGEFK